MPVGLDRPYVEDGVDHGHVRRPLPLTKALDDVLVAWEMNGEPLPPDHGFPVRLVVPGWVGIASIKWLGELQVTTSLVDSPWNTRWYRMHGDGWDEANAELDRMPVKSTIDVTGPLEAGRMTVLRGRAWAGEATVGVVEVSTDGGHTWDEATLTGPNEPSSWVEWEHAWTPRRRRGRTSWSAGPPTAAAGPSPTLAAANDQGYFFDAAVRVPVTVAAAPAELRREHPPTGRRPGDLLGRRGVSGAGAACRHGVGGRVGGVEDLRARRPGVAGPAEVPGDVDVEAGVALVGVAVRGAQHAGLRLGLVVALRRWSR